MGNRSKQFSGGGLGGGAQAAGSGAAERAHDGERTTSTASGFYPTPENYPSKITHSFWLQQHSWLHSQPGVAQADQEAAAEANDRQENQNHPIAKPHSKLLARFTGLMRDKLGGGGSHSQLSVSQVNKHSKSPSPEPRQHKGGWFYIKSLSGSASHLLNPSGTPSACTSANEQLRVTAQATANESRASNRSRSSCSDQQEGFKKAPMKRPNPPSPYRQIAKFLSGSKQQISRERASNESTKRSRLVQFDTNSSSSRSAKQRRTSHNSGSGLLSNLFLHSPLFKRRECSSSCCSSSAASGSGSGGETPAEDCSGWNAARKRKKKHLATGEGCVAPQAATLSDKTEHAGTRSQACSEQQHYADEALGSKSELLMERDRDGVEAEPSQATEQRSPDQHIELKVEQHQLEGEMAMLVPNEKLHAEGNGPPPAEASQEVHVMCEPPGSPNEENIGLSEANLRFVGELASGQQDQVEKETVGSHLPLTQTFEGSSATSVNSLLSIGLEICVDQPEVSIEPTIEPLVPVQVTDESIKIRAKLEGIEKENEAPDNQQNQQPRANTRHQQQQVDLLSVAQRPVSQPVEPSAAPSRHKVGQTPSSGVGVLRSGFKKLVKRQQSVDSYRMARDLKNKLKRQHGEGRNKHQSNEAIKTKSVGDDTPQVVSASVSKSPVADVPVETPAEVACKLKICIDPYAKPGSFTLPGESLPDEPVKRAPKETINKSGNKQQQHKQNRRSGAEPPNTLSLIPNPNAPQPFVVGSFSGCITPTYPTHHLPSPKYTQASVKKYSNASSTLSSSLGADNQQSTNTPGADTESHLTNTLPSPANLSQTSSIQTARQQQTQAGAAAAETPSSATATPEVKSQQQQQLSADEAYRRAQLVEHIYDNRCGLGEDMKCMALFPEVCDITFLVGETREPVCAVKSVLCARSRVFHKILLGGRRIRGGFIPFQGSRDSASGGPDWPLIDIGFVNQRLTSDSQSAAAAAAAGPRRDSSLRNVKKSSLSLAKSSSPSLGRSTSPQNSTGQTKWTVMTDTFGLDPGQTPSPQMGESAGLVQERGGRSSVASQGRDSLSGVCSGSVRGSQSSSYQPLIIGPGQLATPAPSKSPSKFAWREKKGSIRNSIKGSLPGSLRGSIAGSIKEAKSGSKLTRMFTKRASDPSIKHQNSLLSQLSYLDSLSLSQKSTTMIIEEFEPDVFRALIEYIHTGAVLLQARTLLGLLNAADYYGLEPLRKACLRFVTYCVTVDTVCSLLSTAERYIQYKCTKSIVQKVLEFVDTHADDIFKLNQFGVLPEHVVRLILGREGLQVDETVKYNGIYTWCEHYCRSYEITNIADVMHTFLHFIQFHKIPTSVLLSEIYPTRVVPDNIFLSALAYQADPQNIEPQPKQARRMTLPNPTIHKAFDAPESALGGDDDDEAKGRQSAASATTIDATDEEGSRSGSQVRLQPTAHFADESPGVAGASPTFGSQQQLASSKPPIGSRAVRSRKSAGGQPEMASQCATIMQQAVAGGGSGSELHESKHSRATKMRKGSIAQASISGMVRLSRKLSIKKRFSAQVPQQGRLATQASGDFTAAGFRRRLGSVVSSSSIGGDHAKTKHRLRISKQQSAVGSASVARDPLQVGQQILDAYLEEQRQREAREEAQKQQEKLEKQTKQKADGAKKQQAGPDGKQETMKSADEITTPIVIAPSPPAPAPAPPRALPPPSCNDNSNPAAAINTDVVDTTSTTDRTRQRRPIVKSLSTRKSFKDFKHISRRIFMRHSSSKTLHLQSQEQTPPGSPTMSVTSNQQPAQP